MSLSAPAIARAEVRSQKSGVRMQSVWRALSVLCFVLYAFCSPPSSSCSIKRRRVSGKRDSDGLPAEAIHDEAAGCTIPACRDSKMKIPVLVSFGMGIHSIRRSFPRKRESSPTTAHFKRFAEWIPAFAGMTALQMTPVPKFEPNDLSSITNLEIQMEFPQ